MKVNIDPELSQLEGMKKILEDKGIEVVTSIANNKYIEMAFKALQDIQDVTQIYDKPKSNSKYMRNK